MSNQQPALSLNLRSDGRLLSPGTPEARTLLIDVTAAPGAEDAPRSPLAVVLAVDVSGSMAGGKIEAVREACARVVAGLDERDLLGIVTFDSVVTAPLPQTKMDSAGRSAAASVAAAMQAGSMTALAGGWRAAADALCVEDPRLEGRGLHVVVISDGMGNQGETRPEFLSEFAAATALRGIGTSAIGVGDEWSSDQLEALAMAGGGRLHHAITTDEISMLLLGELRGMQRLGAVAMELTLSAPDGFEYQPLTPESDSGARGEIRLRLGAIERGAKRVVAVRMRATDAAGAGPWAFEATLRAVHPETREPLAPRHATIRLDLAADAPAARAARDECTVREVAELWFADFTRRVIGANRLGVARLADFRGEANALAEYCGGVPGLEPLARDAVRLAEQAEREWQEADRKMAQMAALKLSRGEALHAPRASLSGFLRDALDRGR